MQPGKEGFSKIGLYADAFTQHLYAFKFKSTTEKSTVDSLRCIHQGWSAPQTFMTDGGSHFDCAEVCSFCNSIDTKHHIMASYALWLNGLLERSNGILLNTLKCLCTPGLGEDKYEKMEAKDIPKNWPDYLDAAVKHLSDHILPSIKFSPNKLLFSMIVNLKDEPNPENITESSETDIAIHLAYVEQQRLDSYAAIINHAAKQKRVFNGKVLKRAPWEVVFNKDDLVQVHQNDMVHTMSTIKKLILMWSTPWHITSCKLNSCTLETLNGTPLSSLFNVQRLWLFVSHKGTKLAAMETVRRNRVDGEEVSNDAMIGNGMGLREEMEVEEQENEDLDSDLEGDKEDVDKSWGSNKGVTTREGGTCSGSRRMLGLSRCCLVLFGSHP